MSHLLILPPPLPEWEGLHPLVVHLPIGLLMVAPLFVLLGFLPRVGNGFRLSALLLFVLGTIGAYVAIESGEASAEIISFTPEARETLERHAELAETARLLFTVLTVFYGAVLALPWFVRKVWRKEMPRVVSNVLLALVIVAGGLCMNVLANAGHLGGRLVYVHRVENWVLQR